MGTIARERLAALLTELVLDDAQRLRLMDAVEDYADDRFEAGRFAELETRVN